MNITSRKNAQIQQLRLLQRERSERRATGEFVIEGAKMCGEALKTGMEITSCYATPAAAEKYSEVCAELAKAVRLVTINDDVAECISDTKTPQGIFITAKMRCDCFSAETLKSSGRYLILDNLQDAGNVGTIIRTCDAFSLDGLILSDDCADVYSPKVVRSTMGSLFRLPVFTCNIINALEIFAKSGYNVYAAMLDATADKLGGKPLSPKTAVVIGNEGNGISRAAADKCNKKIYIPMSNAESLNAAVAAAVICWEMRKQED